MQEPKKRGRPAKSEVETTERRRRRGNSGDLKQKLAIPQEIVDNNSEYELRWANDEGIRLYELTKNDDWDFVTSDGKPSASQNKALSRYVGQKRDGSPLTPTYLESLKRSLMKTEPRPKADLMKK